MSCFRGGHAEHVLCYRPHAAPPFLSLFFYLDRQILSDLVMEMEPEERPYLWKWNRRKGLISWKARVYP